MVLFFASCSNRVMPTEASEKKRIEKKKDLEFKAKVILILCVVIYGLNLLIDDTVRR